MIERGSIGVAAAIELPVRAFGVDSVLSMLGKGWRRLRLMPGVVFWSRVSGYIWWRSVVDSRKISSSVSGKSFW